MVKYFNLIILFCSCFLINTYAQSVKQPIAFELVNIIGEKGSGDGQFSYIEDFAFTSNGHLLVTDAVNANVQLFDTVTGKYIDQFGRKGNKVSYFEKPEGIAVAANGDIYIADYASGYIQHFDKNYQHLNTFSDYGELPGETLEAEFMSIYEDKLLLADSGNNRIDVFNLDGDFLYFFDGSTSPAGKMKRPEAAKADSKGNIWVTDLGNNRIQLYDQRGKLLKQLGKLGNKNAQFDKPTGLALDSAGNIYVAEAHNDRIQVFDTNLKFLLKFGQHGSGPTQFKNIHGVAVDTRGYLFVADTGNHRIQVFKPVYP